MREITGTLSMLGSGKLSHNNAGKSFVHYSSIEIGDTVLQKMRTAQALGDYLERGLKSQGPVTLYLAGKLILAVKLDNGRIYYWKRSLAVAVFLALLALPVLASPLLGASGPAFPILLGFWCVFALVLKQELLQIFVHQPAFAAQGGTPLRS